MKSRPSKLMSLLGSPVSHPVAFGIPALLVLCIGIPLGVWDCWVYQASARIIERVQPLVAQTTWPEWRAHLHLDPRGWREQILSRKNLELVAKQLNPPIEQGRIRELLGGADPSLDAWIQRVRRDTGINVSHAGGNTLSVEITILGRDPSLVTDLAAALAENQAEALLHAHEMEVETAHKLAVTQAEAAWGELKELTAQRQWLSLREVLQRNTDRMQQLLARRARMEESIQQPAPAREPVKVQEGAAGRWGPIVALEKDLARLDLSAEERKRMTHWIEQLRRNAAQGGTPNVNTAGAELSDRAPIRVELAQFSELDIDLEECRQTEQRHRAEIDRLQATLAERLDLSASPQLVDTQLARATERAQELNRRAEKLRGTLAAIQSRQLIDYSVDSAPAVLRIPVTLLVFYLVITGTISLAAGLAAALCARVRDSGFHSLAEARGHLPVSVLGAVPIGSAPKRVPY